MIKILFKKIKKSDNLFIRVKTMTKKKRKELFKNLLPYSDYILKIPGSF